MSKPEVISDPYKKELSCKLSDETLQMYGAMLARKLKERDALDEKKKAVGKEYSAKISVIDQDIRRMADARDKGEELRPIDCVDRWNNGTVETVRLDTAEVVEVRAATPADRQTDAFIPGIDDDVPDFGEPAPSAEEAEADNGEVVTSSVGDQVFVGDGLEDPEFCPGGGRERGDYDEEGFPKPDAGHGHAALPGDAEVVFSTEVDTEKKDKKGKGKNGKASAKKKK